MEARGLKCENRSRYVARRGSLVVAFLLCLGVFFLPLPASGSEVPSTLLDDAYLVTPAEEAEGGEKSPLKSELLTMLLLTLCFGLSVGWLLKNAQRRGALCSLAVVHRSFATTCEDLPSLGVFLL
jgi:hypothetical protein